MRVRPTFDNTDWDPKWKALEDQGYYLSIAMYPDYVSVFLHAPYVGANGLGVCWHGSTVADVWKQAVQADEEKGADEDNSSE